MRSSTADDAADFALALEVIQNYDLTMILEWVASSTYRRYLAACFGLPKLKFPELNKNRKVASYTRPPDVTARLQVLNEYDILFYRRVLEMEAPKVAHGVSHRQTLVKWYSLVNKTNISAHL